MFRANKTAKPFVSKDDDVTEAQRRWRRRRWRNRRYAGLGLVGSGQIKTGWT